MRRSICPGICVLGTRMIGLFLLGGEAIGGGEWAPLVVFSAGSIAGLFGNHFLVRRGPLPIPVFMAGNI